MSCRDLSLGLTPLRSPQGSLAARALPEAQGRQHCCQPPALDTAPGQLSTCSILHLIQTSPKMVLLVSSCQFQASIRISISENPLLTCLQMTQATIHTGEGLQSKLLLSSLNLQGFN